MKKLIPALFAIAATVAGAAFAAKLTGPAAGAPFKKGRYTLVVTELKAATELNLAEPKKSKRTITLSGAITVPEGLDGVLVKGELKALSAVDADGRDLLAPARKQPARSYRPGTYVAIERSTGQGPVKLEKTSLLSNAYTIGAMTVETDVIRAKQRVSKRLRAAVMAEPVDIVEGLSVRITGVKLAKKNHLTVTVEFSRQTAGPGGPFIEAVYALDEHGMKVGGGPWSQGALLAEKGKVMGSMQLKEGAVYKTLRLVAVTESKTDTVSFRLTKIFQQ